MPPFYVAKLFLGAVVVVFVLIVAVATKGKRRRRRSRPGAGALGTVYDMLNEDKRNAVELIVEQKAEARDPERAAGNLPDLNHSSKQR